jgi:hypothetical protein
MYPIPTGTSAFSKSSSRATLTQSDSVKPFSHCHMGTPLSAAKSQRSYRRLQNDDLKQNLRKSGLKDASSPSLNTVYSEAQTRFPHRIVLCCRRASFPRPATRLSAWPRTLSLEKAFHRAAVHPSGPKATKK